MVLELLVSAEKDNGVLGLGFGSKGLESEEVDDCFLTVVRVLVSVVVPVSDKLSEWVCGDWNL